MMKKIPIVFLCGDRSPYGMAHLESMVKYFDVKAIIIADDDRWDIFRHYLSGGEHYCHKKKSIKIIRIVKSIIRKPLVIVREKRHKKLLNSFGVPVVELHDVNSKEAIALISAFSPDILISAAYPQIFSQNLINITSRGSVNFHPSLLPKYRGAHPHYWCLATGAKRSGVTAHFMTTCIDDGDIIAQIPFAIEDLYYAELYNKIIEITPKLVEKVALFLNDVNAKPIPQAVNGVSLFRNDREIHRKLDFHRMTSRELYNHVRAGGAYGLHREKRIFIERVKVVSSNRHMTNGISVPAGTIVDISFDGVVVSTVDTAFIIIKNVKWGRKVKPFTSWVAKFEITIGERLV